MAGLHSRTHPAGAEAEAERPEARGQCPPHNHISHSALLPCPCVTSGESFPISRAQFPHLYGEANTVTPPATSTVHWWRQPPSRASPWWPLPASSHQTSLICS